MTTPYATVDQIRAELPDDDETAGTSFAELLQAVHDAMQKELELQFGGDPIARWVYSGGDEKLYLPPPGHDLDATITVVEEGTTLVRDTDYELDPDHGRWLLRLDEDGEPTTWCAGRRKVYVTYVPSPPPASLIEAEIIETVRLKQAGKGGYTDTIGVDLSAGGQGTTQLVFAKAFTAYTSRAIDNARRAYLNERFGI